MKVDGEARQGSEPPTCMPTFVLFVLDGPFLDLDELVPFFGSFFVQESLWYPCEEICRIDCLLQAMMRYVWLRRWRRTRLTSATKPGMLSLA